MRMMSKEEEEPWVVVDYSPQQQQHTHTTTSTTCIQFDYSLYPLKQEEGAFERAMTKSLLISADMAHALHPNYPEKHEDQHRPMMNKGVVMKENANQRYATTSITMAILRQVAVKAGVPLQEFVVRNDSPCGSTIGPMLSAKLGLRTIDIGRFRGVCERF